jgi:hypothetical protein
LGVRDHEIAARTLAGLRREASDSQERLTHGPLDDQLTTHALPFSVELPRHTPGFESQMDL